MKQFNKPHVSISKVVFSGGNEFTLSPQDKIIIVGPNNSGKSQSLREISEICQNGKLSQAVVISDLEIKKSGSTEDFKKFLQSEAEYINGYYSYKDWHLHENMINHWSSSPYLINNLAIGFIKLIAAEERLTICKKQSSISPGQQKSKPQHILYDDEELMKKISTLFYHAFKEDLMFDFRGGSVLPIHVGTIPNKEVLINRVGDEYVNRVRKNPLLDKQGDGMKSYAGILFEAIVANRDITLIDEPEAFLHPPQMRRLGETLSSKVSGQLIVATHSSDILRGFLEGTRGNIRILRICRENDVNKVYEASQEVIRELWRQPVLRYSTALEGIFHEQIIICEDDSDCRLFDSIADYISALSEKPWKDTSYIPSGGKHNIPKIAAVLLKVGVPVKAVFDMDFLSDSNLVKSTVEAFGGVWTQLEGLWRRIDCEVRKGIEIKTNDEIKNEIIKLLNDSATNDSLPSKNDISNIMNQNKAWAQVKRYGITAIPRGDAQRYYNELKAKLNEIGIFIVPVGEVENFNPEVGSHGPKFVTKLLTDYPLDSTCLSPLKSFVTEIHEGIIKSDSV
ncbi:ATP-dependent nuclease [Legionella gresilensis]|uniref:ATP-dependent nuclease n=1 Tax=Legionella gresilensis TaxID=91823 RepID=UPI001041469B|nr:AAA family ATPase [Legionella gresilensis]